MSFPSPFLNNLSKKDVFIHIGNTLHHISNFTFTIQHNLCEYCIFFTGGRKPLNLKYWPENEEVQMAFLYNDFLQLFTTSFGAQSFGTLFFP